MYYQGNGILLIDYKVAGERGHEQVEYVRLFWQQEGHEDGVRPRHCQTARAGCSTRPVMLGRFLF